MLRGPPGLPRVWQCIWLCILSLAFPSFSHRCQVWLPPGHDGAGWDHAVQGERSAWLPPPAAIRAWSVSPTVQSLFGGREGVCAVKQTGNLDTASAWIPPPRPPLRASFLVLPFGGGNRVVRPLGALGGVRRFGSVLPGTELNPMRSGSSLQGWQPGAAGIGVGRAVGMAWGRGIGRVGPRTRGGEKSVASD